MGMRRFIVVIFICLGSLTAFGQQMTFGEKLSDAALLLTKERVVYDPAYVRIDYPNGDVPAGRGVCTDVVIRAYRKLGIDLQKEVHEDMKANYRPGDIVTWVLDNGMTHIGLVVNKKSRDGRRFLIVHNIGAGQVLEDCLFRFKITGHYRYGKERAHLGGG
ncbi:hypothetical protein JCM6292_1175 [Bacteroides pyogenes JCM 6292]|uniref:DUF1287 domain-containing protein n=3 Tax=Bacteroides pyogenes TaxID=310300 RepID=W4PHH8_9BACE|nr:hypothetical protein JCM6292_1175 [Bacteroides pyogenes JCM 6292]GAE18594.1 hypothetical protein JCM6294_1513 [Bacteroides pyogenes DSM 20611 = JCM 6294]